MENRMTFREMMRQVKTFPVNKLPNEVSGLFRQYFNTIEYKWRIEPHTIWESLDRLIGKTCFIGSEFYCFFDDGIQHTQALQCLSWIITVFQDDTVTEEELIYAFELVNYFPLFWQVAEEMNISFPQSLRIRILSIWKLYKCTSPTPNSYINHVLRQSADLDNCDWRYFDDIYYELNSYFTDLRQYNSFIKEPLNFLARHYRDALFNIIEKEGDNLRLFTLLTFLPITSYIDFVVKSNNRLAIFIIIFHLLQPNINSNLEILSKAWGKIDRKTMTAWMKVFNRYPGRFPFLQRGLGKFLAHADIQEITVYFDSLNMKSKEDDISDLLHVFFKNADNNKQIYFCQIAYKKWLDWGCPPMLGGITKSPIDSIVIRYFEAPENEIEREAFISDRINEILNYQDIWFDNIVEEEKYLWRLLSKLQPAVIASAKGKDPSLSSADLVNKYIESHIFKQDLRWNHRLVPLKLTFVR